MLDPKGEWIFEKIFLKAAAPEPPRLTRLQKKRRRRYLKTIRKMLLHFAGHHYTHVHSAKAIDHHLLEMKFIDSSLPISVPRSLRFSLGPQIGVKKTVTWMVDLQAAYKALL